MYMEQSSTEEESYFLSVRTDTNSFIILLSKVYH